MHAWPGIRSLDLPSASSTSPPERRRSGSCARLIPRSGADQVPRPRHVDDPVLYDLIIDTDRVAWSTGSAFAPPSQRSLALARDASVVAQTRACLLVDPATRGLRPAVTAAGGRVTLAGMVDSDELRDRVSAATRGIVGGLDVVDKMVVVRIAHRFGAV
jgi:BON domain